MKMLLIHLRLDLAVDKKEISPLMLNPLSHKKSSEVVSLFIHLSIISRVKFYHQCLMWS